jgi:hypothetical protein
MKPTQDGWRMTDCHMTGGHQHRRVGMLPAGACRRPGAPAQFAAALRQIAAGQA